MTTENHDSIISDKEILDLTRILNLKYASYLKDRLFQVDYCAGKSELLASLTLHNTDKSFFYQVEAKASLKDAAEFSSRDAILAMVDYIDIYFDEFFKEEEDVYLPIDWTDMSFENLSFQMRGQVRNLRCEFLADELLKEESVS